MSPSRQEATQRYRYEELRLHLRQSYKISERNGKKARFFSTSERKVTSQGSLRSYQQLKVERGDGITSFCPIIFLQGGIAPFLRYTL